MVACLAAELLRGGAEAVRHRLRRVSGLLATITGILRRFPAIVRELNSRYSRRPPLAEIKDEYDVQNVLRGVLSGLCDDVRDEETTPSHAGLRSRIDLLLKREQIAIETEMTRDGPTSAKSPRNWPSTRSCTAPTRTAARLCSSSMTPATASPTPPRWRRT